MSGQGEIYFIECMPLSAMKIGFTRTGARNRLKALQTGCPAPLRLSGCVPGTQEEERKLHEVFRPLHMHGEWFRYDHLLLDWCSVLFAGDAPTISREQFEVGLHDIIMQVRFWHPILGDYDEYCASADWEPFSSVLWDRFGPWERE
jgi:hypothetical protein